MPFASVPKIKRKKYTQAKKVEDVMSYGNIGHAPVIVEHVEPKEEIETKNEEVKVDSTEINNKNIENINSENVESTTGVETSGQNDVQPPLEDLLSETPSQESFFKREEEKIEKWVGQTIFEDKKERFGFVVFMIPVVLLSIVSTMSLIEFFSLGHPGFSSVVLGIAFETAQLATIVATVLLRRLSKWALWLIIFILLVLQVVGNTYAPFFHLDPIAAKPAFELFGLNPTALMAKRIIAGIQGVLLPITYILMFKISSVMFKGKEKKGK